MASRDKHTRFLMGLGIDAEESALIASALALGRGSRGMVSMDTSALRSVRRTFYSGNTSGKDFRSYHTLVNNELKQLTPEELAFGDIPDWVREQHSAFSYTMFQGHQTRYLDRHEDETVNEFLDRPGKATLNVTRLVIDALSKLYHKPPLREFKAEEGTPEAAAQEHLSERLAEVWGNKLFNQTMIHVDKMTRLLGTVAVRPIYDPDIPGKVRPWVFMSHQLRVIPDPLRPWRPAAVIERVHPFENMKRRGQLNVNVWTDRHVVNISGQEVTVEEHQLGRIPHVFCRDDLSFNSYFVEGRGRDLCEPNAVMNNDLTDLEEIKQMQGFAVMQIVNPSEDDIRISPRTVVRFDDQDKETPYGVEFKTPEAPLDELRNGISNQIKDILMVNNVPVAALGAQIDKRSLSGTAIRAAMQPITDDLEERERIFEPIEADLADSILRVVARHEQGFTYQEPVQEAIVTEGGGSESVTAWVVPDGRKVAFDVKYKPLSFPSDTRDQIAQDDFDIAQGMETPASIMRRRDPDAYSEHADAVAQWHKNRAETAGFDSLASQDDAQRASYGGEEEELPGDKILSALESAGLVEVS